TRDTEIASAAKAMGAEHLEERGGGGYSEAVAQAACEIANRQASAMLCVPGDVPGVRPHEISRMLRELGPGPAVVLCPSRNERGTNAALVCPPGALPLCFGEPSFAGHVARARDLGLATRVLSLEGLSLDLDTPDDIDVFLRTPSPGRTYRLLREQALVEGGDLP
ncbi:MAG TPA: NTP transferase domain-containing protein, partial [Polyangiaceae bacterium]|nr:NTP transferase domain-containing protein [Polyangiaceae bacterium]